MTGRDDGGFSPYPGDPWHPGFPQDADVDSEVADREKPKKPKKQKPSKEPKQRRGRRADREEAEQAAAAAFDPSTTAFDAIAPEADSPIIDDDPFDAVLQREGRAQRFKPASKEVAPPPAWTVDSEPDPDQRLAVEQPSWIGHATGGPTTVEAVGFEESSAADTPQESLESEPDPAVAEPVVASERPELVDVDVADLLQTSEEETSEEEPFAKDVPQIAEDRLVGAYGVAGPEAFDALATDDAATGEYAEWDAFASAEAVDSEPAEAIGDEPKKRRGRRGRKQADPEDIDAEDVVIIPGVEVELPRKRRGRRDRKRESFDELTDEDVDAQVWSEEAFDSYDDVPPAKRRGLFRRKQDYGEIIDDGFVGAAFEPELIDDPRGVEPAMPSEAPPLADGFGMPAEPPAGLEAFDEWMESAPTDPGGLFKRGRRRSEVDDFGFAEEGTAYPVQDVDGTPDDWPAYAPSIDDPPVDEGIAEVESVVVAAGPGEFADAFEDDIASTDNEDLEAVVARALEALGVDAGDTPVVEAFDTVPAVAADDHVPPAHDLLVDGAAQGDLFAGPDESPVGDVREVPAVAPPTEQALVAEPGDDDDEEIPAEWEGDVGRVPAAWMADIDEDEVVPPQVPETPDTEWAEDPEPGPWEGQARWQAESTEVFDIEEPAPPVPYVVDPASAQEIVAIPEGYEPWQNAVENAVAAAGSDVEYPDDGTYEYEQPLLDESGRRPEALPAGFEPFPGGGTVDQFELPEESVRAYLDTNQRDDGWVTDDLDPMPDQVEDAPFIADEFDERIYASGGTIEHRDLAAAIALSGEEDTQWQALSAAMPGMETGVLGFDDVADLGSGGEYVAPIRSDLGPRVATGLALVALLFGSLFVGPVAFAAFIGIMVLLALVEFYGALRRCGYLPLSLFGLAGGVGTLLATWFHGPLAIPAGILITATVTFFFYAFSATRRDALSNAGLTVFGVSWIVGAVAFAIPISRAEDSIVLIFAIVAVTAATDIGAFSFGRTWGRRPLAPTLSPNKTTEGLAGGVLMAFVAGGAIGFLQWGPFDLASGLALATVAAFTAPLGDLAESMIKRSLGLKDMGHMLPGHGGILDRIDAFLFVIPAAWVLYKLIGFLG